MVPLITAHDRFLRESYAFFASIKLAFTDQEGLPKPGVAIPYVLFAKLIQLGRAVHFLVASGYTEEAEPLGRAMVSAALNIVGIVDKEPEARALRFMAQSQEIRAQLIKGYIDEGYVSAEEIAKRDEEWRAQEDDLLKRYAKKGIVPAKIDDENKWTWHGLSDQKLAKVMNASRWYNLYYRNFSDEAHANVASVTRALRLLYGEQKVHVGPTFSNPWMVMFASGDTIGESLGQLDTLYGLKRRAEVDAINERFGEALKKHRSAMPAPDVPLALSEPAGAKAEPSGDAKSQERPA
jgi:hypothetical protein